MLVKPLTSCCFPTGKGPGVAKDSDPSKMGWEVHGAHEVFGASTDHPPPLHLLGISSPFYGWVGGIDIFWQYTCKIDVKMLTRYKILKFEPYVAQMQTKINNK